VHKELIEKLEQMPDSMLAKEKLILEKQDEIEKYDGELDRLRRETRADIHAATNDDGKPMYSNERQREDELKRRLGTTEQYLKLSESHHTASRDLQLLKAEYRYLESRFKSLRAIALLLSRGDD